MCGAKHLSLARLLIKIASYIVHELFMQLLDWKQSGKTN